MTDFSIRDILTKVQDGIIRIPTFQRGFVWDSDTVAFFMDSIYKNYPFGTIQLWRTREKLKTERTLGPDVVNQQLIIQTNIEPTRLALEQLEKN